MIYSVEFTKFGNPTVRSAPLLAPLATQRNLKLPRVLKWYTKEQLEALLKRSNYGLKETRFDALFKKLEKIKAKEKKSFRFSEAEDAFIRNNYQYLPDSVIALALNIPVAKILNRRNYLGLKKLQQADDIPFVIVWDKRSEMDKDLQKEGLTLLREGLRW